MSATMWFKEKMWAFNAAVQSSDDVRTLVNHMTGFFLNDLLGTRWIVSEDEDANELGIKILGIKFWYYKWPDPMVQVFSTRTYRTAKKREFGEVIRSQRVS